MFFMPLPKEVTSLLYLSLLIRMLRQYNSVTHKLVKIPVIDSIIWNPLQLLKLKFSQIDKRGDQIKSGEVRKISKN